MQPVSGDWRSRLWGTFAFAGISMATLTWIPVISRGGTVLELPNMIQLMFILLLPAVLLFSRPAPLVHLFYILLVTWSLVMLLALALHGTQGGSGYIRQQFPQALSGWALALCIANSNIRLGRVAVVSLLVLFAALEYSAVTAGSSALVGAFEFLQSLDRTTFVYYVLRPALNVFVKEGDPLYVASQINNVANMIVVLGCLAYFSGVEEKRRGMRLVSKTVGALALIFAFIMFSSSAVLVMAVFALVSIVQATMRLPPHFRNLSLLALLTAAILLYQPLDRFLEANLTDDEASRADRLEQAQFAVEAINSHPLAGVGYAEAGGNVIHNWMLFSWATSGILAFLLVLATYTTLALVAFRLVRAAPKGTPTVVALTALFVVRTSVGGAGGIPSGPAILAAAIVTGLMARHAGRAVRRALPHRLAARSVA